MNEFKLAFKMAKRELINRKAFWFFFMLNLLIGLVGFSSINLLRTSVNSVLERRAKVLLSSDFAISGRRALTEAEESSLQALLPQNVISSTSSIETYSMGVGQKQDKRISRLLQIKAVEVGYPLIGSITTDKGAIDGEILANMQLTPLVIISPEVAYQFKLKIGDILKLGIQEFRVHAVIKDDSTSSLRGVGLAPKVYIGKSLLDKTKLISYGSVATYSSFYNLPVSIDSSLLRKKILKEINDPGIKVLTPKNSNEQLNRMVNYLADYLGLIGVVALLISSVGASYLFQNYIYSKIRDIGIFKSLGIGQNTIFLSFILLLLVSGFISFGLSVICSSLFITSINYFLESFVTFEISTLFNFQIVGGLFSIAILVNLCICLPILFELFSIDTISLLKERFQKSRNHLLRKVLNYLPLFIIFWALSTWQSHSFIIGGLFTIAISLIVITTTSLIPFLLNRVSRSLTGNLLSRPYSLSFGMALRYLSRNSLTSVLILLSLTVGIGLISLIGQLDKSLKMELVDNVQTRPSLFMFDIQEEQHDELLSYAKDQKIPLLAPMPMVRARLTKKNNVLVKRKTKSSDQFDTREDDVRRRFNNRGVNLSFAQKLNASESLVKGTPFREKYSGDGIGEISLEERYSQRIGAKLGDVLTFDILGVEVQGRVVNLRKVKWTSFLPNFFIIFQPGVIDGAPKSYIAAVDSVSKNKQLEIQDQIISKFPNVSILNVDDLIKKILLIFKSMANAVSVMSISCILVGLFVLYSILQNQMRRKGRDFALQKMLGVSSSETYRIVLVEFMLLGFFALFFGQLFGIGFSFIIAKYILNTDFILDWKFFGSLSCVFLLLIFIIINIAFKKGLNRTSKTMLLNS